MTTEVQVLTPGQAALAQAGNWTNREAQIIGTSIAPGLDEKQLRVFAMICKHTGMDPFRRQIYAWVDKGRLAIHLSINGWRGIAARSGEYAGQVGPEWCGIDGVWRDVWLAEEAPAAARVGVLRQGNSEPVWGVATLREFGRPLPIWKEKPAHMLAIRAEYQALQKACPEAYAAAVSIISESKAILDVGEDSAQPPLPEGLNVETGEMLDAGSIDQGDSPGSRAEGEGALAPSEGNRDHAPSSPGAEQPSFPEPTPFRFEMTDATWESYTQELAAKGVEPSEVNRYLGKAANAKNVEAWCREQRATPLMLVDYVVSKRGQQQP